jgi:anti-sigma regulatory factor (Ser/Thr protein kinase)
METIAPRICFPARTQCLELIRSFCREILEGHACEPQVYRKLILAIDEAVANVIEHAYASDGVAAISTIELSIDVQPDRVVARILDRGRPFDPRGVDVYSKAKELAEAHASRSRERASPAEADSVKRPSARLATRGFGLHLIRLIIDEIDYQRTPDGENVLILTKHLRKGQEA